MCKRLINTGRDKLLADGLVGERDLFVELFSTEDQTEGVDAFLEKRKPVWKNQWWRRHRYSFLNCLRSVGGLARSP